MAEKRVQGTARPGTESAKAWMEQYKAKQAGGTSSFAPRTPPAQRSLSTFSSPGSMLGKDEDSTIIELTSRNLYAGIEGESGPQCRIAFGPEGNRRVGDYRSWIPGHQKSQESTDTWGQQHELWRNDVSNLDLELLSDILERTVREAHNKYLLVDAGVGRLVLVLPSLVPHQVLETILSTLFRRWKYSTVTLLPAPAMSLVSAGTRSALVVDMGWEETVVTAICEYREVGCHRSTKAMKLLSHRVALMLDQIKQGHSEGPSLRFDLDFVEDFLCRAMATVSVEDLTTTDTSTQTVIEIEWPGQHTSCPVNIPRHAFIKILQEVFLHDEDEVYPDDHEIPVTKLIFKALLALSPDVRGLCMSRVIFIGQGSESLSLRSQILKTVEAGVSSNGWTSVKGRHFVDHSRKNARQESADAKHDTLPPASNDTLEERLQKQKAKLSQPTVQGEFRELRSLGAWAGASLVASLKIRGFVEIERERFLPHGLSGASRDAEISVVPQQRMSNFGLPTSNKPADRTSWTLAGWG